MPGIDLKDDLEVTREDSFKHADGPALQSFWEEGMVSVGKSPEANIPGLVPTQVFKVHENSH